MAPRWLRNWPLYVKLQVYGILAAALGVVMGFGAERVGSLAMRQVALVLVGAGVLCGGAGVLWAFFVDFPRSVRQLITAPPWRDLGRIDERTGRPRIITLICVFGFAVAGGVALSVVLDNTLPGFAHRRADWTPDAEDAFLFGMAIALVGYWRMRRWGVWLLGAVVAAEVSWLALTGSLLREWNGLTGPVVFLLIGARYYRRMA